MSVLAASAWPAASAVPRLDGDDVHVWLADVDSSDPARERLVAVLSTDERARAGRFCFDRDRRHYAHSRGILRHLLAAYLDDDPRAIQLDAGARGKPVLARPEGRQLAFNVSHSGTRALIAVSRRGDIGVDIEAHRPLPDQDTLARQFFSPRESARLASLPQPVRAEAFFRCWTRKEAYVKAVGDGLAHPLDTFDVTFAPGEAARLDVPGDRPDADRWTLEALPAPSGYAAALVTEGRRTVKCWAWSDGNAEDARPPELKLGPTTIGRHVGPVTTERHVGPVTTERHVGPVFRPGVRPGAAATGQHVGPVFRPGATARGSGQEIV